jgi:hypothetical protein
METKYSEMVEKIRDALVCVEGGILSEKSLFSVIREIVRPSEVTDDDINRAKSVLHKQCKDGFRE